MSKFIVKHVRVEIPDTLKVHWNDFRSAIDAAAAPFTTKNQFALSPDNAFDLPQLNKFLNQTLHNETEKLRDKKFMGPVHASFLLEQPRSLQIEISWSVPA